MTGYSKNPLWKKLGIKTSFVCHLYASPSNYFELLDEIPEYTSWDDDLTHAPYDFIHVFVQELSVLSLHWASWKKALKKEGSLWVSWPKGTSKIQTDLNGNSVRAFGINGGLVDIKVCAIDSDWSGLKFVYRKKDR